MGKRKVLSESEIDRLVLPAKDQLLGRVTQLLGYDRFRVKCADGVERVCRVRGKMKRRTWIKSGDYVLVAPWDFQDERGDILWRYRDNQIHLLEDKGLIVESLRI
ncbi:MAG: translation initiation factor eIF-1A [Candidatus Bathyarchaeia archaeon]|nr:translation initiation factor eIF-1A [Candidatus Bathyarchaeota archaeon]